MRVIDKHKALGAVRGLTFADCVRFFGERTAREQRIAQLARARLKREGELEIDDVTVVSEGEDNGAYVMAWVWLDFSGAPGFSKEPVEPSRPSARLRA